MPKIHVLDKHTAELIAAGEVVERPASVAKELLENAIDAGATQITLSIRRGGIEQLQISDNGSGIESDSIENAFIRHATSKIAAAEDLAHIHTLGFRGEALASIASVARVELLTKSDADEFALCYRIAGGVPQGLEPGARGRGTTITVSDLFYNTPARMKFLKKDVSEGNFVADAVAHAALSHPEISFRFVREGKQQFVTPGDGSLRSAAYAVLGREFARDLLDAAGESGPYKVTGLITPPRTCRGSRSAQHFYVNGRYVKNRTMMAGLENAYKGTVMQGKFPGAVLMLSMPAELVDVNVHPAKTEIRFGARERLCSTRLPRRARGARHAGQRRAPLFPRPDRAGTAGAPGPAAVRGPGCAPRRRARAAKAFFDAVSRRIPRAARPDRPRARQSGAGAQHGGHPRCDPPGIRPRHRPGDRAGHPTGPGRDARRAAPGRGGCRSGSPARRAGPHTGRRAARCAERPAPGPNAGAGPQDAEPPHGLRALPDPEQQTFAPAPASVPLRLVGEVFKTYIITEREGELCLIDKHAAHERILFEQLSEQYGDVPAQLLLVPVQVNLSAEEKQAVMDNLELLRDAGIEAEDYGGPTVVVRAVPADVPVDDVSDMLLELADRLKNGGHDALREKTEWVLHSIACRAAVKAGDRTGAQEMVALAQKILDGSVPPFCPHGRPCVLKITRKELEKQFGRLV